MAVTCVRASLGKTSSSFVRQSKLLCFVKGSVGPISIFKNHVVFRSPVVLKDGLVANRIFSGDQVGTYLTEPHVSISDSCL